MLAALATLGLAGTSAAHYGGALPAPMKPADNHVVAAGRQPAHNGVRPLRVAETGGGWLGSFLDGLFGVEPPREPRRSRRRAPEPRPAAVQPAPPIVPPDVPHVEPSPPETIATYRTMCVRLCDGYYWPMSFATTPDNFERDERTCTQSCSSSAALYYYPNPGGEAEDMVSLQGVPYKSLGTAFLHRTSYDEACKCRPHPWEPEAIERHKSYAKPAPKPSQARAAASGARRGQ